MEAECAEVRKCPWCGYTLKSSDFWPIVVGELSAEPPKLEESILHCICYECGQEWVE